MKIRKSIRAVLALMLAAALVCTGLPTTLAYNSDGEAVTLPDGGTYILTDYVDEGDFDVYFVNSTGTRLTTSATDSTVGVSIRGVEASLYRGTAGYLYIPDTYGGYPVVRIEKLKADNHFLGVRIPASVTELADQTFSTCPYLEWIEVDVQNTSFFSVNGVLYRGNRQRAGLTALVCYPQGKKDESFTTSPDGDGIADRAFNGNPYLKTLTIAVGALGTNVGAICNCTALETLIFGEGQMSLDFFSVTGCSALKTVHFSDWFLNFLDYWNAETGGEEIADYLARLGTDDLTVCCAAPSALLEAAAQEAGIGYSVCGETHTHAQDVPPDAQDPNAPTVSAETAFWFTNYYQRDADGKNVLDENGLPIVIGYAVEGLLTRNIADAAHVIIPAYHFGLPVLEIQNIDTAFDNLVSVHIPATVESIKPYAFMPGEKITEFTVDDDSPYFKSVDGVLYTADGKTLVAYPQAKPDTVFTIPEGTQRVADSEYTRLSSNIRQINIPASFTDGQLVKTLRRAGLEMIRVDAENPVFYADASGVLYNKDQTTLLHYPTYGPQDYTLPSSVTMIGEYALGGNAPRTLRIADGVTFTPVGSLSVSPNADEPLCLHIPASVTTIRLTAKGKIQICSTTRASQAAAFAAANGLPFYICSEDHSVLREPTDDDPPAPALNDESIFDCSFIYETDETGVEQITGACVRGLLQTPDEPFVLTVPDTYCGVPVREVNIAPAWAREHSAKVTKIELPATVQSVRGVYNRAMLMTSINAFRNLAAVTVDEENPYLCAVDGVLFDKEMNRLVLYPAAKADASYAIPDGVRDVKENPWEGGYVFGNNPYLRHLTIPASFTCEEKDSYGFSSAYFNALLHLPALQSITVDPANPTFASDANGALYNADRTQLILYPREATAEIFAIPASVDRILSPYTFRKPTHLRVLCVAEGATQTPDGYIGTTGALQYVHIPSSVQNVRLTVNGAYQSICSDSANCAAAAYAQENSIPFALCSDAHTAFTPTQPDDLTDVEFDYYYMLAGNTVITGVCITGLKEVPDGPYTLTFPSTYADYPVLMIDFSGWSDEACSGLVGFHIPASVEFVPQRHDRFVNLRHITVDEENPVMCAQDDVLFNKISGGLVWYPLGKQDASYAIPDGVNHFRSFDAFLDNPYLKTLSFPASFSDESTISSMISRALYRLPNLQSISVDADNPYLMSDANGVLYNKDQTKLICYPCAAAAEVYTVPASVTHFESGYSIAGTKHLRVLCFADGVEQLPAVGVEELDGGFIYCRDLQYVHIPSSVLTIDDRYKTLRKSVTICSDSADSAAAAFAAEWKYTFRLCSDDHTAFTEPDDPPVTPTAPIALTVSGGTARPGDTVQVTVDLVNNPGVAGMAFAVQYDPQVLALTAASAEGMFTQGSVVMSGNLSAMPFRVLWDDASATENHTEDGTVLTLTFTVRKTADAGITPVTVSIDPDDVLDVRLQAVELTGQNAEQTILRRIGGDADGDGDVTAADVICLTRYIARGWNVEINALNSDVNRDGAIDLKDVVLIRRYLVGGWGVDLS